MESGGIAQGGASGVNGNTGANSGAGAQSNNQATTTTSIQQQATAATLPSSSGSSSSQNPRGVNVVAVVGGVVGGLAGLFLILFFGYFILRRRRVKKRSSAEPVTYATLNTRMAGVPFIHRSNSGEQESLVPPQPAFRRDMTEMRGGAYNENEESRLYFLPTYAESQAGIGADTNSGIVSHSTYAGYESESTLHSGVSLITPSDIMYPHEMGGTPFMPQYSADIMGPVTPISPQPTAMSFIRSQRTTDTMGFPVTDPAISYLRSTSPAIIIAPIPRPLMVHQDSLERSVRERGMSATSQGPGLLRNDTIGAVSRRNLTPNSKRMESPTLGVEPVWQHVAPPRSHLNEGVTRSASQDTRRTSFISGLGDSELENLGVVSRWV